MTSLLLALFACSLDNTPSVYNEPPEVAITSPGEGTTLLEGGSVTLTGAATDREDDAGELTVTWYAGDTEICAGTVPDAEGVVTCAWTVTEGTEALRLFVTDLSGASADDQVGVTVTPNDPPSITLVSPAQEGEYYFDAAVTLEATVSDTESTPEELVVSWSSDVDGDLGEVVAASSGTSSTAVSLSEGAHVLTATVTDPGGNTDLETVQITVHGVNTAPDCAVVSPATGTAVALGDVVLFEGTVSDAETAPTALVLSLSSQLEDISDAVAVDDEGAFTWPWTTTVAGTHVVTLTGEDRRGESCTDTLTVEVCDTAWYSDGDGDGYGDTDVAVVSCEAPEGYAQLDGDCNDASAEVFPGAAYEESLTDCMQDGDGDGWGDASVPEGVTAGSDCDDADAAINPDGDEVCDGADNDCDGTTDGASAADASTWYADADADTYGDAATSTLDCDQPAGYVADRTDCDDTTSLRAPDATEVCDTLDNDCDGVTDPDTSADAATWFRDADADGYGDAATTDTSCEAAAGYVADDSDCDDTEDEVYPFADEACNAVDDNCDGLTDEEDAAVDCNEAPSITSVVVTPDPAYAGDPLVCTPAGWSDADGDAEAYTYAWTVDGVAMAETSEVLTETLIRDQVVRCTATPWDGAEYGTAWSDSVTISNSAPSAPVVAIAPSSPSAGEEDLVCEVVSGGSDPDGDAVSFTFAWTADGVDWTDADTTTWAGDTISVEDAFEDEVWACSVTAADGTDTSTAGTDSVTMGESARDGTTVTRAGLSCDQIESDWPDSYNADYWVYPSEDTTQVPELTTCIFDNHVETFAYSGAEETWTVPSGVAYVTIKAWGAGGGLGTNGYNESASGGDGGTTVGVLPVSAGQSLVIVVGEGGLGPVTEGDFTHANDPELMGGGGQGAPGLLTYIAGHPQYWTPGSGSGGGYSGVFDGSVSRANALVVAGGGGGAGGGGAGGSGGGETAESGYTSSCYSTAGGGGSQSGGGTATIGTNYRTNGAATTPQGAALYGGSGSYQTLGGYTDSGGGGGGGGYYGGGGGHGTYGTRGCGGGGGSGYLDASAISGETVTGLDYTDDDDYPGDAGQNGTSSSGGWPVDNGDASDGYLVIRY